MVLSPCLFIREVITSCKHLGKSRSYNLTKKFIYAIIEYYCFYCIIGFSWPGESYFFEDEGACMACKRGVLV